MRIMGKVRLTDGGRQVRFLVYHKGKRVGDTRWVSIQTTAAIQTVSDEICAEALSKLSEAQ